MEIHGKSNSDNVKFAEMAETYKPLVDSLVNKYSHFSGHEAEDLRQEAMIALYGAYVTYDSKQSNVTFGLYAKVCIRNRIISVLRKSRVDADAYTDSVVGAESPEDALIAREEYQKLLGIIDKVLTPYEKSVFSLYLKNMPYKKIAQELGVAEKSVDNAIYRIKAKIKQSV